LKKLTHIIIILAITGSCIQPNRAKKDTTDIESEPNNTVMKFKSKKVNTPQKTLPDTSWIYPPFLTADFNGDSHIDTAFAIKLNKKKE
jgi:hypothetical protein